MAIVNRTLDITEQKKVLQTQIGAMATGATLTVCTVPFPSVFYGGQIAAFGLSGAPSYALTLQRFIVGTGATNWILATGTSNVAAEFGTSGVGAVGGISGIVCIASSSTLAILQANDVICITSGVANTAVKSLSVGLVIAPTADIKYNFGLGI